MTQLPTPSPSISDLHPPKKAKKYLWYNDPAWKSNRLPGEAYMSINFNRTLADSERFKVSFAFRRFRLPSH